MKFGLIWIDDEDDDEMGICSAYFGIDSGYASFAQGGCPLDLH